jgi:UDP-N-acetylmuramoyl-tripeptide--D-alanyl-D-alanine ligase
MQKPARMLQYLRRLRPALADRVRPLLAYVWRRLMIRTTVLAITGSVGKTTCKDALAAVLSTVAATHKTLNNQNDETGVPRTLLAMRPWHRFAVVEVGTGTPGQIRRLARIVKPDVAIVLSVARTHTNKFATLDDTAEEKSQLLRYLSRRGTAILNADDGRVRPMAQRCRARVLLFGESPDVDVVAERVESRWPDRLGFSVRTADAQADVRTRLVGTHWLSSVLAAIAASRVCGVPLDVAAKAVEVVEPVAGRMQPIALPNGAVVVRDEENGSPDTFHAMVKVMREARAVRRVLVMSDLSDSKANPRRRQRDFGQLAAELTGLAVFVGDHGHHAARAAAQAGMDPAACHVIPNLKRAAAFLSNQLQSGDLVFLKGRATDHLSRILFAQLGSIGCWTETCKIHRLCDQCSKLQPAFDLSTALIPAMPINLPRSHSETRD